MMEAMEPLLQLNARVAQSASTGLAREQLLSTNALAVNRENSIPTRHRARARTVHLESMGGKSTLHQKTMAAQSAQRASIPQLKA